MHEREWDREWDRTPGVPVKTIALTNLLGLVRGLPYRDELTAEELDEHLAALVRAMVVYDALHRRDLDDDERAALELEAHAESWAGWE